jgi:hypothetical protein
VQRVAVLGTQISFNIALILSWNFLPRVQDLRDSIEQG